jgi:hypothetical protein
LVERVEPRARVPQGRPVAGALSGLALAGCVAATEEAPDDLAAFVREFDSICAQTFPSFAGAEARMRALGYVERGPVPGMHSDPARGVASLRYHARPTPQGRPTCSGTITTDAGEARVVAALKRAYPLEPLGEAGTTFRYRDGALGVSGGEAGGRTAVVVVMMAPR